MLELPLNLLSDTIITYSTTDAANAIFPLAVPSYASVVISYEFAASLLSAVGFLYLTSSSATFASAPKSVPFTGIISYNAVT